MAYACNAAYSVSAYVKRAEVNVRRQGSNTQNKHHIIFIADRRKVLVEVRVRVALQNRSNERSSLRSRSKVLPDDDG